MIDANAEMRLRTEFLRLQRKLGLERWDVKFDVDELDGDALATTDRGHQCDEAVVTIAPSLFNYPWTYQRATLIHELLHLHMRDMAQSFAVLVKSADLTRLWRDHFVDVMLHQEELFVDRLARVLEPAL